MKVAFRNFLRIFATVEPAKPLNNAQIGRSFFFIMKAKYTKVCNTPEELVILLKSRGLQIEDENRAQNYLSNIGYFRLSAYFYPLLTEAKAEHIYKQGATFSAVMNMYRFDRKLRLLLFNEIEKIEVSIRSALINIVSKELNDVFWMTNAQHFKDKAHFTSTLSLIDSELGHSKEDFIIHFKAAYSNAYPPAWMIAEILPLGTLSHIYMNLSQKKLKKLVAAYFGLQAPAFSSWILILGNLRNMCCHHSRTWNREIPIIPASPVLAIHPWIDSTQTDMRRIYCRICLIKYLLYTVSPHNTFTGKLKSLLATYPTIDINAMGFPANWEKEPLWQ